MRFKRFAVLGISTLLVAVGCGDEDEAGSESGGELTVSAASSLTGAFETYGEGTEAEERFSFAGSDELAAQIRQGAPVDVYAAANTSLPDALFEEGVVEEPVVFAQNKLVLAVPSDTDITEVSDLTEAGLDLVIGADDVPVGDYTREILGRLPGGDSEAILANVRSEEPDVKSIVAKLSSGAGDAGFVYVTDVVAAGDELEAIELPPELQPEVSYGIAVVAESSNADAARGFIDGLLEGDGSQALLDAGFLRPKGTS